MRVDDSFLHEEDAVFCYRPINRWQWGHYIHSSLYYEYHEDHRKEMLRSQAECEPELALVIACSGEMGLFGDCAEVCIWRAVCELLPKEMLQYLRKRMPELTKRILDSADSKDILRELYFSMVIPVVVAMDAQEMQLAIKLFERSMEKLERTYG